MPELPEVETIRRALQSGGRGGPAISGWEILSADLLWDKTLAVPDKTSFKEQITGQRIIQINRRAKYLDIEFRYSHLLIHLRMSGDIRVEKKQCPIQTHDRLVIEFSNAYRLVFNDTRKFGRVWFLKDPGLVLNKLGPEPLDEAFTADEFYKRLKQRKRLLKPLLLDQTFIAGLGNIYTDEALHLAGLHPQLIASELSRKQASELLSAIRHQLNEGISKNGASIDWIYRGGSYQNSFRVYGKHGKPCAECGTLIARLKVGQRGTHICPQCQPFPNPEHYI